MRRPTPAFLVMALLASPAVIAQRPPAPKVTVFERARVIVGDGGPWIEDAVFVVEGGRFTQVGRRGAVKIPRGATRVNLAGKTVMPAIIDTEASLTGTREEIAAHLRRRADFGAAVVMTYGPDVEAPAFRLRHEIIPDAARLLAGLVIAPQQAGRIDGPTSEADARRVVRELSDKKVELLQICVDECEGSQKALTPELYKATIDEAHIRGLRVIARVRTLQSTKDLLRAGVDALSGVAGDKGFDREVIRIFRDRPGVFLVANLSEREAPPDVRVLRDKLRPDELTELEAAPTSRPAAQGAFDTQVANLGRLSLEKIRMALGSNSGRPWGHLVEMQDMDVALQPFEVIVAATHNAAALLGLRDQGSFAPAKSADFLVLGGNPAFDLKELGKMEAVYLRGVRVDATVASRTERSGAAAR